MDPLWRAFKRRSIGLIRPSRSAKRNRANRRLMQNKVAKCDASNNSRMIVACPQYESYINFDAYIRIMKSLIFNFLPRDRRISSKTKGRTFYDRFRSSSIALCKRVELIPARCAFLAGVSTRPVMRRAAYASFHFRRAQIVQCGQPTTRNGQTSDIPFDCKRTSQSKRRPRMISPSRIFFHVL